MEDCGVEDCGVEDCERLWKTVEALRGVAGGESPGESRLKRVA